MIVMKFGGTSVQNADCIRRAVEVVASRRRERPVVVLSATGTTTRDLLRLGEAALTDAGAARTRLDDVLERHRTILADLDVDAAERQQVTDAFAAYEKHLDLLLQGVSLLRQYTPQTQDALMGHGERFTTRLFCAAARKAGLDVAPIDAATVMITDARFRRARPDRGELATRAQTTVLPLVEQNRIPVIEGFVGATRDGVATTMGFEASDYTASLLGAALGASEIQIWTDVGGMLTTGHRTVKDALSIRELSFAEAAELSFFGAKVLHPNTIEPAIEKNIPVRILHSRHPDHDGTTISAAPDRAGIMVKSIAVEEDVTVIRLRPLAPAAPHRTLWSVGEALDRHEVSPHLVAASGNQIVLAVAADQDINGALQELGKGFEVTRSSECAIVSLVGQSARDTPGVVTRATKRMEDVPLFMASWGASDLTVSVVVSRQDADEVVARLHDEFFGDGAPADLFKPTAAST